MGTKRVLQSGPLQAYQQVINNLLWAVKLDLNI